MTQDFHYLYGIARPAEKLGPKHSRSEVGLCPRRQWAHGKKAAGYGTTQVSATTDGLKAGKRQSDLHAGNAGVAVPAAIATGLTRWVFEASLAGTLEQGFA